MHYPVLPLISNPSVSIDNSHNVSDYSIVAIMQSYLILRHSVIKWSSLICHLATKERCHSSVNVASVAGRRLPSSRVLFLCHRPASVTKAASNASKSVMMLAPMSSPIEPPMSPVTQLTLENLELSQTMSSYNPCITYFIIPVLFLICRDALLMSI